MNVSRLFVGVLCTWLVGQAAFADELWLTNMDEALAKAKEESKSVLVDFTGSDWCVWCIRLDEEVFDTDEFRTKVSDNFVPVKLDFPRDDSGLSKEQKKHNSEWKTRLAVNGFPTVYLLDDQGRPYSKLGYAAGGPEPYLEQLAAQRKVLEQRDVLFAEAEALEGVPRAKKLDEALSLLDENLATTYYDSVLKVIGELDAEDEAGLRTKYFAAEDAEKREQLMAKIRLAERTLSPQGASRTIDLVLAERKLPSEMQLEALRIKLNVLRRMRAGDPQLECVDQMLELEGLPSDEYQRLLSLKAFILVSMERTPDALAMLSERIDSTLENRDLYMTRAELLLRIGQLEKALGDYRQVASEAAYDGDILAEVALAQSECLLGLEQADAAIEVLGKAAENDVIFSETRGELLVQQAMLLRELGRDAEAQKATERALEVVEDPEARKRIEQLIDDLESLSGR